jgi:hypothetical protein
LSIPFAFSYAGTLNLASGGWFANTRYSIPEMGIRAAKHRPDCDPEAFYTTVVSISRFSAWGLRDVSAK